MRILLIKFLLLLCFNLLSAKAQFDQSIGYYITNTNDTVKASFKDKPQKELVSIVSVYDSTNTCWSNLYPGQINKFYISQGDCLYESQQIDIANKPTLVFLRCLVDGNLNLYSYDRGSKPVYYLMDSTKTLIKLEQSERTVDNRVQTNNKYLGQLKCYMNDNPKIFDEIDKTEYKKQQLIRLFENYHNFTEKEYTTFYKSRSEVLKNIQLGGFYSSSLKAISSSFYLEFYNLDFSKRSSLRAELNGSQINKYSQVYEQVFHSRECVNGNCTDYFDTLTYKYDEQFMIMSTALSYQYKYFNKICTPYFYIGFSFSVFNYQKDADNELYSEDIGSKFSQQLVLGLGLEKHIYSDIYIYAEYRMELVEFVNAGLKYRF